ncbi:beta-ketoacyl-[acyl-carrier-protein] synthase family protein [Streptomyces sp. NPDC005760]|uniref:beta-ketoacyl-[acyl-carrier-protein] synthase family protein n=1 Tax=Streptomyces sp. NPDC005760 TaxID=3156718 RepID=UPI0033E0BC47
MRKAVITGIGVIAPGGVGTKPFWEQITSGRSATRAVTHFDASRYRSRIAGEVDFDPLAAGLRPDQADGLDRMVQFALAGLREALEDSGFAGGVPVPERAGVSLGSAVGCTTGLETQYAKVSSHGRDWLVDHTLAAGHLFDFFVPTPLAREVAWAAGAEGPAAVVSTGCTSGLDAVGYALDLIRDGSADVMITGASDAPLSPITYACFDALRATSPDNHDPAGACRPFDRTRNGFALGEGAAIFVLEEYEHARRRGAHMYAELAGFATRCNAYHMTGLRPDGREMAEAIRAAMAQACAAPEDFDYINAHGSGTRQNDLHETAAFKDALGPAAYDVPVSSIKSMIGHALGSVGSIEIAACALAVEHGVVPPTANLHEPDPECDLDYVPLVARETAVDVALTVGSGFGGFQSAAILRRAETS